MKICIRVNVHVMLLQNDASVSRHGVLEEGLDVQGARPAG